MRALQQHDYKGARDVFTRLLTSFPTERALLERVRVFLDLCERELRNVSGPATVEERLTLATAALNNGDDDTADRLAQEVIGAFPDHDLALYILAAVHSRRGNAEAALHYLRHAIKVSPDISAQARHDMDFARLRDVPEFRDLLERSEVNGDHRGQARRLSRRSDR
jgi:tetratricopeptide (TPR) repeat protein